MLNAIVAALLTPYAAYLLLGLVGIPFMGVAWHQHRHEAVQRGLDQIDATSPLSILEEK